MKKTKIILIVLTMLTILCACSEKNSLTYGVYKYTENENADSNLLVDFKITINEDGTFSYIESAMLSSATNGTWIILDGNLVLKSDVGDNYFDIENNKLTYIGDKSENFQHVKVKDGEEFVLVEKYD